MALPTMSQNEDVEDGKAEDQLENNQRRRKRKHMLRRVRESFSRLVVPLLGRNNTGNDSVKETEKAVQLLRSETSPVLKRRTPKRMGTNAGLNEEEAFRQSFRLKSQTSYMTEMTSRYQNVFECYDKYGSEKNLTEIHPMSSNNTTSYDLRSAQDIQDHNAPGKLLHANSDEGICTRSQTISSKTSSNMNSFHFDRQRAGTLPCGRRRKPSYAPWPNDWDPHTCGSAVKHSPSVPPPSITKL